MLQMDLYCYCVETQAYENPRKYGVRVFKPLFMREVVVYT